MIAVAKRGSAKIITPAADWIRWAHVRDPTTRKKASLDFPVKPDDAGQAAENLSLTAFGDELEAIHGRRGRRRQYGCGRVQTAVPRNSG